MSTGEPLFSSAHTALSFAFTYSDLSHTQAALAESMIAGFGRDRYGRPASSGRGLVGLDGAAQAGMIRAIVEREDALTQLVAVARFAKANPKARRAACRALALRMGQDIDRPCSGRSWVVPALLGRHFGLKVDVGRLADQEDVDPRTIRRWQSEIRKWAKAAEARAMHRLEEALEERGLVVTAANAGR